MSRSRLRCRRTGVAAIRTAQGLWLHPSVSSHFIESLNLFKSPTLAEGLTPDQYMAAMVSQEQQRFQEFRLETSAAQRLCGGTLNGWFNAFSGVTDGRAVVAIRA
jgi:hypothetical protein